MSFRAIQKKLNDRGDSPPSGKKSSVDYWLPTTVRGILRNEIYIGKIYFGVTRIVNGKIVKQPREKWIETPVPDLAFIEPKVFAQVQVKAKKNKERAKRNRKRSYLLTGHIKCGSCGYAMYGHVNNVKTYPTMEYRHRLKSLTYDCKKTGKHINAMSVDKNVWDWLVWLLTDSSNLEAGLQDMINNRESEIEQKRERFDVLDNLILETEREIKSYVEELPNHTTEIARNSFREKIDHLSKNHNSITDEKDKLEQEILQSEVSPEEREVIFSLADEVYNGITNSTYEDKRYLLDTLDVQLEFHWDDSGNWVSASCAIPTINETIVLSPSREKPSGSRIPKVKKNRPRLQEAYFFFSVESMPNRAG